jgi:hypothetical protein
VGPRTDLDDMEKFSQILTEKLEKKLVYVYLNMTLNLLKSYRKVTALLCLHMLICNLYGRLEFKVIIKLHSVFMFLVSKVE